MWQEHTETINMIQKQRFPQSNGCWAGRLSSLFSTCGWGGRALNLSLENLIGGSLEKKIVLDSLREQC